MKTESRGGSSPTSCNRAAVEKFDFILTRPQPSLLIVETIPIRLTGRRQWVAWRYRWRDGKNGKHGKWTKVLTDPKTGRAASVGNPAAWGTFEEAMDSRHGGGIEFVFSTDDHFYGIDLGECFEPDGVTLSPWVRKIIDGVPAYWERRVSGTGLHAIGFECDPLPPSRRCSPVEHYRDGGFFALTGHVFEGHGMLMCGAAEFFTWYERHSPPA
jgi:primase-polymerase (primpol)-like protein